MLNKTMTNAEIAALYLDNVADTVNDEEPRSDEATIQRACIVYEKVLANDVVANDRVSIHKIRDTSADWLGSSCVVVSGSLTCLIVKCDQAVQLNVLLT